MKDTKIIKVINKNSSKVCLKGMNREYVLDGGSIERPTSTLISYEDIDYINSNTEAFRSGLVTFEDSEFDAMHESLGNVDIADTYYDYEKMRDMILNPTYAKMQRIVAITSVSTIERFRGALQKIKAIGAAGVPASVEKIIMERSHELNSGKRSSAIILKAENIAPVVDAKTAELEAKIARLEALVAAQSATNDFAPETPIESSPAPAPDTTPNPEYKRQPKKNPASKKS